MFQVVSPKRQLKMALLMTSKLSNPLNRISHNSTNLKKQVLCQAHLMQIIKGFISCTRNAWARTHEISELARFVKCHI